MEKKKEIKPNIRQNVVYVGPSFREAGLSQYMGFLEGVPDTYGDDPVFRHLFVTPEGLNQALADKEQPGTLIHTMCAKALAKINGARSARASKIKED